MAARDWSANTLLMMEISGADSEKYRLVITSQPTVLIVRPTPNKTSLIVNLVHSNSLNEGRLYVAASGGNMMRQETKRLATITVLLGFFVIMLDNHCEPVTCTYSQRSSWHYGIITMGC